MDSGFWGDEHGGGTDRVKKRQVQFSMEGGNRAAEGESLSPKPVQKGKRDSGGSLGGN